MSFKCKFMNEFKKFVDYRFNLRYDDVFGVEDETEGRRRLNKLIIN